NLCIGTGSYTLIINCPGLTVNPPSLPSGTQGTAYSQTISATGGFGSYSFAVTSGSLPNGLTLNAGTLSGTPTLPGTFNFTITATDSNSCPSSRAYTVFIACPAITVNPASLPDGAVGTVYNQTITAGGGTAPYTYLAITGALPAGLTLNSLG